MTASPISDLNPVFMAAGCKLTVMSKGTTFFFSGQGSKVVAFHDLIQNTLAVYVEKMFRGNLQ